jgi:hypothetical protein
MAGLLFSQLEKRSIMNLTLPPIAPIFGFQEFVDHVDALLEQGKTTGDNHSEAYLDYTRLNQQRAHRIYKHTAIMPALMDAVMDLKRDYIWMVIAEAWCGDVPQNMPVIAKLAELNDHITFEIILRDTHPEIMDHFTTHGGRAIPILVVMDADTRQVITRWGPRPAAAQQMVLDYKAITGDKPPYSEFVKDLQLWYHHDKTETLQAELLKMVQGLEG